MFVEEAETAAPRLDFFYHRSRFIFTLPDRWRDDGGGGSRDFSRGVVFAVSDRGFCWHFALLGSQRGAAL